MKRDWKTTLAGVAGLIAVVNAVVNAPDTVADLLTKNREELSVLIALITNSLGNILSADAANNKE